MINVRQWTNDNGSISIKLGRSKAVVLQTAGEADAFLAGVKLAHIELTNKIAPILKLKDTRDGLR